LPPFWRAVANNQEKRVSFAKFQVSQLLSHHVCLFLASVSLVNIQFPVFFLQHEEILNMFQLHARDVVCLWIAKFVLSFFAMLHTQAANCVDKGYECKSRVDKREKEYSSQQESWGFLAYLQE
jgi:hypothetical protein